MNHLTTYTPRAFHKSDPSLLELSGVGRVRTTKSMFHMNQRFTHLNRSHGGMAAKMVDWVRCLLPPN